MVAGPSDESSTGVDVEVHQQSQGTPLYLRASSRPGLDLSSSRHPHTLCTGRGLPYIAWRQTSGSWCQETSRRHACQETRGTVTSSSHLPMMFEAFLKRRVNAEISQICVWSRGRPGEKVGSVQTVTSESCMDSHLVR